MGIFWSDPAPSPSPSVHCETVDLNSVVRSGGSYISLIFTDCPTEAALEAFTDAAQDWSDLISENRITPAKTRNGFAASDFCSFIDTDYDFEAGHVFDHLTILSQPTSIDGSGGVLASAAPCAYDSYGFPLLGGMKFDSADLSSLERSGTLKAVVKHEMGHVLGLGTLFRTRGLSKDLIFRSSTNVKPNSIPKYIGSKGLEIYKEDFASTADFVPLEDGKGDNGAILMDASQNVGRGSIDVHFKKTIFEDALMTYSINSRASTHPISPTTLGSLVDLGYAVDFDALNMVNSRTTEINSYLRGILEAGEVIELAGDVEVFDERKVKPLSDLLDE
eukprot:snap_masked-scaffold_5-processed-gene-5.17-mRNA-1 protein AED:0.08 eAED:1.00 QI:0/-1/0/1/-1/1/1/0/332